MASRFVRLLAVLLFCVFVLHSGDVFATESKDIKALSKAVGFIQGGPTGDVEISIVFDPTNRESSEHASNIMQVSTQEGGLNKVKFVAKKVPYTNIDFINSKIIFVTRGMEGKYQAILDRAVKIGAITVSTDENCLNKGACVLVVKTEPDIDILVSMSVADKIGVEFSSAFSMMITKR